jgi:Polyketide cyclase / dehydrase and lipid transport
VRLELTHRFAVPLRDGFDYITDLRRWPEYWPDLVRVEPGSRWSAPGDRARVVMRLLGRSVELQMTLRTLDPYRLVTYATVQHGLPDARHERRFTAAGDGFDFTLTVELEPRPGLRGVLDRVLVRRAVERTLRRTVANLEDRFAQRRPG